MRITHTIRAKLNGHVNTVTIHVLDNSSVGSYIRLFRQSNRHFYPPLAQSAAGKRLKIVTVPIRIRGGGPSSSHYESSLLYQANEENRLPRKSGATSQGNRNPPLCWISDRR